MFTYIVLTVFAGVVVGCGLMLVRNSQVYNARLRLLDKVSEAADRDIQQGKNWKWRYDVLRSVTYKQMMRKFWVKPENMYPDNSFYN